MFKIVLVIAVLGIIGIFVLSNYNSGKLKTQTKDSIGRSMASLQNDKNDENEPPLRLKSIGIEFSDFKFTKEKLQFDRLFMGYGFYIPAGNDNPAKYNPQPTFVVPLGTPVRAIVDGVVADIPTLWSGDYSIRVTENGKMEKWSYETEHLINPKVKVGDPVRAGQIVGEVSDFNHGAPAGFGTVEIGIGIGGNPPHHICPFAYLDDSIKEETFKKMRELFKSWEDYIGDQTLYSETTIPGCLTDTLIEG
ncbi:MAG: M23 family metallopeptidase [Candidatus Daviesbacteria bacterium]|nr:M23 family metallopeptidase [Candidatus Daviesbacteria bacterium]